MEAPENTKKLGRVIAERRQEINADRKTIAVAAYITSSYLGAIERGRVTPPNRTLFRIFSAIQLDPALADRCLEIAAESRGLCIQDAGLPDDVSSLIEELRRGAFKMPLKFVQGIRRMVREIV